MIRASAGKRKLIIEGIGTEARNLLLVNSVCVFGVALGLDHLFYRITGSVIFVI